MLKLLISSLLLICFSCTGSKIKQENVEHANEVKAFLVNFLEYAKENNKNELRKLIHPTLIKGMPSLSNAILQNISYENEENLGDLSYSAKALAIIIDKYSNDFSNDFDYNILQQFKADDEALKKTPNKDFLLFKKTGISVILVKIDSDIKLVFWEGMNRLLKTSK